jgi:peptidoglycan LD-endopeptidase CwlK
MRGLDKLHPKVRAKAEALIERCKAAGLEILITETFRSKAEQDALYAKGRTTPGAIVTKAPYPRSPHCWAVAFDICRATGADKFAEGTDGFWAKVGAIGKELGLFWGGEFKNLKGDLCHFEDPEFVPNNSTADLILKYQTPENFIKTFSKK